MRALVRTAVMNDLLNQVNTKSVLNISTGGFKPLPLGLNNAHPGRDEVTLNSAPFRPCSSQAHKDTAALYAEAVEHAKEHHFEVNVIEHVTAGHTNSPRNTSR